MCTTLSRKSSCSRLPLTTSYATTRRLSSSTARTRPSSAATSTTAPKLTAPLPPAAATCMPSGAHASARTEPLLVCALLCIQPILSHSARQLKEPAAKRSPPGAQATEVMLCSKGLLW